MKKLLIICGPTATGKTEIALELAKTFNGELISADSRQIYKGMDVGTGKDLPVNSKFKILRRKRSESDRIVGQNSKLQIKNQKWVIGFYEVKNIPLWLYDMVKPDEWFSVADYYELTWKVIEDVWKRGKLPILVGGTGFYIKAVIDGIETMGIPQNEKLRKVLESKTILQLQTKLQKINPQKWNLMNNSDRNNKRRLVRVLEIQNSIRSTSSGQEIKIKNYNSKFKNNRDVLMIGLTAEKDVIYEKINERVEKRVKLGIINEIQSLLDKGYGWNLYSMSGLGYRQWKEYFEGNESKEKAIEKWKLAECQYVKRQFTWFKKDKRIKWFNITDLSYKKAVVAETASWYL